LDACFTRRFASFFLSARLPVVLFIFRPLSFFLHCISFLSKVCSWEITNKRNMTKIGIRIWWVWLLMHGVHTQVHLIRSIHPGNKSGQRILYVYAWASSGCYWSPVACQWDVNTVSFSRKLHSIRAAVNDCYTENTAHRLLSNQHTQREFTAWCVCVCVWVCTREGEKVNIPYKLVWINRCIKSTQTCSAGGWKACHSVIVMILQV